MLPILSISLAKKQVRERKGELTEAHHPDCLPLLNLLTPPSPPAAMILRSQIKTSPSIEVLKKTSSLNFFIPFSISVPTIGITEGGNIGSNFELESSEEEEVGKRIEKVDTEGGKNSSSSPSASASELLPSSNNGSKSSSTPALAPLVLLPLFIGTIGVLGRTKESATFREEDDDKAGEVTKSESSSGASRVDGVVRGRKEREEI